jgi:hypothetical protein
VRFDPRIEALCLIDATVNGMNLYAYSFKSNAFNLTDQVDLALMRNQVLSAGRSQVSPRTAPRGSTP